jgi:hypothetical protein
VDRSSRIRSAARALRADLPELHVAYAEELDRQIVELLGAADSGERVEDDLLELLRSQPSTRVYTEYFLEYGEPPSPDQVALRGYSPLPGRTSPIPMEKYSCPRGDFDWYRRAAGVPVPLCPTHRIQLVKVD